MTQTYETSAPPNTAPAVLRIEGLSKRFGPIAAVDRVSFEVHRGEVFGFLGPNGAGKTTTLGMALGLVAPTEGRIELLGQSVQPGQTKALRKVGSLLGAPALYPHLSALRHLELLANLEGAATRQRIGAVLEQVGLSKAAKRNTGSYSTGMKQRLGIAMALLASPELLVLDEPTNGMDPAGMKEIRELLQRLAQQGITVILSSHILSEVEQICDRIAVIHKGRIVAQGHVRELTQLQGVRIRVDSPKQVEALLAGQAAVRVVGEYLEVQGLEVKALVRRLVEAGHVPSEVVPARNNLEELFLQLTA